MNPLYCKNLELFTKSRPDLAQILNQSEPPNDRLVEDSTVDWRSFGSPAMFFCLGFPSAKDTERVLTMASSHRQVTVFIELDPKQFVRICSEIDFSAFGQKHTVVLFVPQHEGELRQFLKDVLVKFNHYSSSLSIGSFAQSADKESKYKYLAQAIHLTREVVNAEMGNSVEDSLLGFKNIVENIPTLVASSGIEPLRNAFEGLTIVSVASGPSLNEALPFLKAHADKFILIACDSSVRPLLKAGLMPHFVTALEREEIVTDYFRDLHLDPSTALIGPDVLLKSTFDAYQGHKAIYPHTTGLSRALGVDFLGPPFSTGLSAGNLNISAAIVMGFKRIILVGHNLGFEVETLTSHAQGVLREERSKPQHQKDLEQFQLIRVPSQDGTTEVTSAFGYTLYRLDIEAQILREPDKEFINTALKGARIVGAKGMSIEQALSERDFAPPDIRSRICACLKPPSSESKSARLKQVQKQTVELRHKMRDYLADAKAFKNSLFMQRQKLLRRRGDPSILKASWQLVEQLQALRDRGYRDPLLRYVPYGVLVAGMAPLEREVTQLNSLAKGQSDFILSYYDVAQRMLQLLIDSIPKMLVSLETLCNVDDRGLTLQSDSVIRNLVSGEVRDTPQ